MLMANYDCRIFLMGVQYSQKPYFFKIYLKKKDFYEIVQIQNQHLSQMPSGI